MLHLGQSARLTSTLGHSKQEMFQHDLPICVVTIRVHHKASWWLILTNISVPDIWHTTTSIDAFMFLLLGRNVHIQQHSCHEEISHIWKQHSQVHYISVSNYTTFCSFSISVLAETSDMDFYSNTLLERVWLEQQLSATGPRPEVQPRAALNPVTWAEHSIEAHSH